VQCLNSADCVGQQGPFCSAGGRCIQCEGDGDCPAAHPKCHAGTCT